MLVLERRMAVARFLLLLLQLLLCRSIACSPVQSPASVPVLQHRASKRLTPRLQATFDCTHLAFCTFQLVYFYSLAAPKSRSISQPPSLHMWHMC